MEPRLDEPLYNEVLGITNDILQPSQRYSGMYGKVSRYNEARGREGGREGGRKDGRKQGNEQVIKLPFFASFQEKLFLLLPLWYPLLLELSFLRSSLLSSSAPRYAVLQDKLDPLVRMKFPSSPSSVVPSLLLLFLTWLRLLHPNHYPSVRRSLRRPIHKRNSSNKFGIRKQSDNVSLFRKKRLMLLTKTVT